MSAPYGGSDFAWLMWLFIVVAVFAFLLLAGLFWWGFSALRKLKKGGD